MNTISQLDYPNLLNIFYTKNIFYKFLDEFKIASSWYCDSHEVSFYFNWTNNDIPKYVDHFIENADLDIEDYIKLVKSREEYLNEKES
jgi:hypothetical protein